MQIFYLTGCACKRQGEIFTFYRNVRECVKMMTNSLPNKGSFSIFIRTPLRNYSLLQALLRPSLCQRLVLSPNPLPCVLSRWLLFIDLIWFLLPLLIPKAQACCWLESSSPYKDFSGKLVQPMHMCPKAISTPFLETKYKHITQRGAGLPLCHQGKPEEWRSMVTFMFFIQ